VWEISDDGKTLIQPLTSIKGLGASAMDQILMHRPFNTIEEFLFHEHVVYSKLNKKALDVLCQAGALKNLQDNRFTGDKHFWTCVAVDRPRKDSNLLENIEKYAPEGDFTVEEKIESLTALTGVFPISMIVDEETQKNLTESGIPPISEFDQDLKVTWFIPRKVTVRKTKNDKIYYVLEVVDSNNAITQIRCWGSKSREGSCSEKSNLYRKARLQRSMGLLYSIYVSQLPCAVVNPQDRFKDYQGDKCWQAYISEGQPG
jgi:DNA polymerase III alpha subunit